MTSGKGQDKERATDPQIFISYSHKDERLKNQVLSQLSALEKAGRLSLWEDRRIGAGDLWYQEIENALNCCKVALLLISAEFLSSDFILREEVPRLLQRRKNEGIRIIPVILWDCAWQEIPWLSRLQSRPLDGTQLGGMTKSARMTALAGLATEILGLLKEGAERPKTTPSAKHNLPGPGARYFVGREEDLLDLHNLLQAGEKTAIRAALQGMGGIGKTELALQYARHDQQRYPGGICWLNARGGEKEGNEEIQYFQYAAQHLGIIAPDTFTPGERLDFIVQRLPEEPALVILDDYAGQYPEFLTRLPERVRILVTTRENPGPGFKSVSLEVLKPAAALDMLSELLANKKRVKTQNEDARALCAWLGHLPLAIELIGAYLANLPGKSFKAALADLEAQGIRHRALQIDETDPAYKNESLRTAKHKSVWAALELSRTRLSETGRDLALLLAQLGPAPIPPGLMDAVYLIYQAYKNDNEEVENDCEERRAELYRLSLLEYKDSEEVEEAEKAGTRSGYRLHPLVREYFRLLLEESEDPDQAEAMRRAVYYCLARVAKRVPQALTLQQAEQVEVLLPHWEEACVSLRNYYDRDNPVDLLWPYEALSRYYKLYSDWERVLFHRQACLDICTEGLKPEDPVRAASLNNMAALYESQGEYEQARPLFEEALAIHKKALGPEHPDTILYKQNLAVVEGELGSA